MAKHKHGRRIPPKQSRKKRRSSLFLLDKFTLADIRKWNKLRDQILQFHWDYYSNLAYKRSTRLDEIRKSLFEASQKNFTFSKWQRVVKHKYSIEPLSIKGSLKDAGGRFNIGDIDLNRFRPFPGFYIASERETALQELLCQNISPGNLGREDEAYDFALTKPQSISSISVNGSIDSIIDLNKPKKLQSFVNLIKDFSLPSYLKRSAKEIGLPKPELVRDTTGLKNALLYSNWREWPMQFDVPSPPQIFGQLVADAGIEGVLYPSKFSGKDCLVVFPQNFYEPSESFVELDDEPPKETILRRWDASTWDKYKEEI